MSDQPQMDTKPTLTPEEELDVLEAVYRVGQEKGIDLLKPDQLKKLISSGRLNQSRLSDENIPEISKSDANKPDIYEPVDKDTEVSAYINLIVEGLMLDAQTEVSQYYVSETWQSMTEAEKKKAGFAQFISSYGLSPSTLRAELTRRVMKRKAHDD